MELNRPVYQDEISSLVIKNIQFAGTTVTRATHYLKIQLPYDSGHILTFQQYAPLTATYYRFKYTSETIGGSVYLTATDESNGLWKLEIPAGYATLHTSGDTADTLEITTYMNSLRSQGLKRGPPGAHPVKISLFAASGNVLMFETNRWMFITSISFV